MIRYRPTLVKTKHISVKLPNLSKMTKPQLQKFAEEKGIELDSTLSKTQIIEQIKEKVGVE